MYSSIKKKIKKYLEKKVGALLEPSINKVMINNFSLNQQMQIFLKLFYKEQVIDKKKKFSFDEVGFDVYSSTFEDGILQYIFSIIGMETRKCVDIGCGAINGSNVANLIINHGFKGLLIDGNSEQISITKNYYNIHPESSVDPPIAVWEMVNIENIDSILKKNGFVGRIDLLSIDLDGIDYWIWKAIKVVKPRVLLVEYQDALGPSRSWTIPYEPNFNLKDYEVNRNDYNYVGASLNAFVKLGKEKGYRLVGCNKGGWNAFFIASGIADDLLPEVSTESCFKYERNQYSMKYRFPLIADLPWDEV